MFNKLDALVDRYNEITQELSDPDIINNHKRFTKLAKEQARLADIVKKYDNYKVILKEYNELKEIINNSEDDELVEIASDEISELEAKIDIMERSLKESLIPEDESADKNTIVEIRAGTGGDESTLFVNDLFRMYVRFLERDNFKIDILSSNPTGVGGYKEIIFLVEGSGAYNLLKNESGVHRVQRVPDTESSGRIHTSAVTVAVLPEAEDIEINITPDELDIEVFRSSGPGGQSVNTTDSAVRVTHKPSGITVSCQDEKSQHKNRAKAMKILKARILDYLKKEQDDERSKERKSLIKSGDRSERIRTYNFPQNRLTDHRIDLTLYNLDKIMEGDLDEVINALLSFEKEELIKEYI
jgi:peptide chain release factor 1